MQQSQAIQRLTEFDHRGRYVFTNADWAKVFPEDSPRARQATVSRLMASGLLERPVRGVYIYSLSQHKGVDTLEWIARALRRGEYNYISLESALSEYGLISQIPVDRLHIMTTGRKGEYSTPFGVVEFTHTKRPVSQILERVLDRNRPLRIATREAALSDLRRVGRNTHLLDEEALNEQG